MVVVKPGLGPPDSVLASARVGEVVATSITEFEAQSVRLHETPPLGALVRVRAGDGMAIYGVVAAAGTDGLDVGARPVPRARDGCEDGDIYREHPDLAHVLRTCFRCLVVGFREGSRVRHYLPPSAAPIHFSVALCRPAEIEEFTGAFDYFRMILAAPNLPVEEVLAAHIRRAAAERCPPSASVEEPYRFSVRAGREVAALLRSDHQRLVTILQRIRPDDNQRPELREPRSALGSGRRTGSSNTE